MTLNYFIVPATRTHWLQSKSKVSRCEKISLIREIKFAIAKFLEKNYDLVQDAEIVSFSNVRVGWAFTCLEQ